MVEENSFQIKEDTFVKYENNVLRNGTSSGCSGDQGCCRNEGCCGYTCNKQ